MRATDPTRITWSSILEALTRPVPLSIRTIIPTVVLLLIVPFYFFVGELVAPGRTLHRPEIPWDRLMPVHPSWVLVYVPLYLFLILLPIFVVRQDEQIRRTVFAYLMVWITALIFFWVYPTVAPRPAKVVGEGFMVWGLRFLYSADSPYNCFPSLHVAHSFVSALTCHRVHRGLGMVAMLCASLVGVSTIYTKQHYILDVLAGIFLACVACVVFLRHCPGEDVAESDRRLAPVLALCILPIIGLVIASFWVAYEFSAGAGR